MRQNYFSVLNAFTKELRYLKRCFYAGALLDKVSGSNTKDHELYPENINNIPSFKRGMDLL